MNRGTDVCCVLELGGDRLREVDHTIAVAPLVVVPAHQLEKVLVELDRAAGVEDR